MLKLIENTFLKIFDEDDLHSDYARVIYRWWQGYVSREGCLPPRSDFNPFEYPKCLPGIVLQQVEHDPFRIKDTVLGSQIVFKSGVDTTGKYLDEVDGSERLLTRLRWLVENRKPYLIKNEKLLWGVKDFTRYSSVALPLSNEGEEVNHILHYMDFVR